MFFEENLEENLYNMCRKIIRNNNEKCLGKDVDPNIVEKISEFPIEGIGINKLCEEIVNDLVPYCTNFHNPSFMGFPDSGNSSAGVIGGVASELLQQNIINATFCAPIATYIEIFVINWFRKLIGYSVSESVKTVEEIGGIVTYGGTMSNAVAMLLARINKKPETYVKGIDSSDDLWVIVPEDLGHYSICASLCWTGCGNKTIEVPTKKFRYDIDMLKNIIMENKSKIMGIVLYAGDSRTMTIEDISTVYHVIKKCDENIWVHVDACNGFCLAFSDKLRYKLNGIELCDSVSLDPHKMMMLPYTASILLVKNPDMMSKLRTKSDLIMNDNLSFGQITPFIGSKAWISLKIWCVMRSYGKKGLQRVMDERYELAQYLKERINQTENTLLLNDVDAFAVVFLFYPNNTFLDDDKINIINKKIYERITNEKKYYIHQFPLTIEHQGTKKIIYPLRFFSGNSFLTKKKIDAMLVDICEKGKNIYENNLY